MKKRLLILSLVIGVNLLQAMENPDSTGKKALQAMETGSGNDDNNKHAQLVRQLKNENGYALQTLHVLLEARLDKPSFANTEHQVTLANGFFKYLVSQAQVAEQRSLDTDVTLGHLFEGPKILALQTVLENLKPAEDRRASPAQAAVNAVTSEKAEKAQQLSKFAQGHPRTAHVLNKAKGIGTSPAAVNAASFLAGAGALWLAQRLGLNPSSINPLDLLRK